MAIWVGSQFWRFHQGTVRKYGLVGAALGIEVAGRGWGRSSRAQYATNVFGHDSLMIFGTLVLNTMLARVPALLLEGGQTAIFTSQPVSC